MAWRTECVLAPSSLFLRTALFPYNLLRSRLTKPKGCWSDDVLADCRRSIHIL
ncbi:hypothetical protein BLL52_0860 [Rhodoferax antarcticus ANT.BR]|uniref:Uncharacterized protein n=1 Tax=Rhodoferax antarcticus ANT.BR TaxID=1111071 RepID=A0A1Q8YI69_9BURK|nr:hypothetical protein BLL52_0860 [Rhodoferax antarcticus ANT.BR]